MKKFCLVFLFVLFYTSLFAQDDTYIELPAVPFLVLPQSPLLFGAGWIGTAIPMQETMGFYHNPAQLGYFSRTNNFSGFIMPDKTNWLSNYRTDLTFLSSGITAGYNFKTSYNIPLSIGAGYIHNRFDYGEFIFLNEYGQIHRYKSYDEFDCFSFGAGYDYYLQFNLGFAVKSFNSITGAETVGNRLEMLNVTGNAYDFGALIIVPVSKLFLNNTRYDLDEDTYIKPKFDFTAGYALTNIGEKVLLVDPAQLDPLPRKARLGYTFDIGVDLSVHNTSLNAIDYSFTAEAGDFLFKHQDMGVDYQGIFGDIKMGKHLIELKGDNKTDVHRGHIFRLFETIIFTSGRINGPGYRNNKTSGLGISSEGIFKLLSISVKHPAINFIADHIVIEYYNTDSFVDTMTGTNFKGAAIIIRRLGF